MSIHIDGIVFSLQYQGGISVYFRELLKRLQRDQVAATLSLYGDLLQELVIEPDSIEVLRRRPRLLERYRPCVAAQSTTLFHSSYYRLPARAGAPTVTTAYDFIYERHSRGPRRWIHGLQKRAALRASDAVICISEATRRDLLRFVPDIAPERLHVVPLGVGEEFAPLGSPAPARPFVLFVGQRSGYKNFGAVLQAMARLPQLELHCVGGGPLRPGEFEAVPPAVRDRVRHLGFVSATQLNDLYNRALCLVYPSSQEGFGIPVLEAMRAGCPVVCVQCEAVLETGGDALTVAPDLDPAGLAAAIERTSEERYRDRVIQAGLAVANSYSWERTYRETLGVYRSLACID